MIPLDYHGLRVELHDDASERTMRFAVTEAPSRVLTVHYHPDTLTAEESRIAQVRVDAPAAAIRDAALRLMVERAVLALGLR